MKKSLKSYTALLLIIAFGLVSGCASTGTNSNVSKAAATVATVAKTAPALARQFDAVYAYLVEQKLVPDHRDAATKALAAMDAVAPLVQAGAEQLTGDNFNWASFILQAALTTAQALGYILPLVV
jgi:hypothetical protein